MIFFYTGFLSEKSVDNFRAKCSCKVDKVFVSPIRFTLSRFLNAFFYVSLSNIFVKVSNDYPEVGSFFLQSSPDHHKVCPVSFCVVAKCESHIWAISSLYRLESLSFALVKLSDATVNQCYFKAPIEWNFNSTLLSCAFSSFKWINMSTI